jgi:RNA polymerase sigma factor (sigma-70 family)
MNSKPISTGIDDSDPTNALLERAKTGEQKALIEIFDRYRPALESAIRRKLVREYNGRDDGWEDCLNEVKLKVALNIMKFDYRGPGSLDAWLLRIALNATEDFARVERKAPAQIPADANGETIDVPDADSRSGGSVAGDNEVIQFVREEMDRKRIPDEHREVLYLRFFKDLNGPELALALNCSHGAARMRLNRALEWARHHISQITKINKAGRAMGWMGDDNSPGE